MAKKTTRPTVRTAIDYSGIRSLYTRIRQSKTATDVDQFLKEGVDYEFASTFTRARWLKAAQVRKAELAKAAARTDAKK